MKSFFKKLAFVMALAMVVTMAAPAGTAALAASFYISKQEVKEEVTNFDLAVGAEQDFRYIGATDYTKYNFAWTSSKTDVATVDKNGLVKGVKDGVAVITCTGTSKADGKTVGYTASMVVTVGVGEAPIASNTNYAVKQDTANTVKISFNNATEYIIEDFELFYVMDGGWTVSWPIKSVDPVKDAKGNVIEGQYILTPYVEFSDGDKYILKVDGEEEGTEFVTSFGELTHLEIHYTCNGVTDQGAVVNTINAKDKYPVQCFVKFFSGDVDVTSLYSDKQKSVKYEMKTSDSKSVTLRKGANKNGVLEFSKVGAAAVMTASYTYKDSVTKEEKVVNSIKAVPIVSIPLPAYDLTLVDWAIVNTSTQIGYEKIDWSVKTMRANDEALYGTHAIVAKFTDSFGKTFISDPDYLPDTTKKAYEGWYSTDSATSSYKKGEYYLDFQSANNDKLLVGLDTDREGTTNQAYLTTHTDADVAIIVGLYSKNKDIQRKSNGFVKNVAAFTVNVTEERYIDQVDLSEDDIYVPNTILDTEDTFNVESFLERTVKLYILDQYGEAWKQDIYGITVIADEETNATVKGSVDYKKDDGYALVTIDGSAIWTATKKEESSVVITLEVEDDNVKHPVELVVSVVDVTDGDDEDPVVDVAEGDLPVLAVNDLDLAYFKANGDKLPRETEIALTYVVNDLPVGYAEKVALYKSVLDAKGEEKNFPAGTTEGSLFLAVYDPNNNLVNLATVDANKAPTSKGVYQTKNDTFSLCAGIAVKNVMDYLKTGEYTAQLRVASWNSDDKCFETYVEQEETFVVSNSSKDLEFVSLLDVETDAKSLPAIIKNLVVVSVGGVKWDFKTTDIAKVEGRYNEDAKQIIIKKIWFNVPMDAYTGAVKEADAYTDSVTINRAIELNNGYEATYKFDSEGIWKKPAQQ